MTKNPVFIIFLLPLFILNGCIPVIFTGATTSAMEFAKDRNAGETLTDVKISTRIKSELLTKGFKKLYTRVSVEVFQGRVLYTGLVEKEEYALTAIEIAWNQPGVNEVINEIQVDPESSKFNLAQYTRDTLITSQIKSKIFMNRSLKFANYTIITINDVVYIFGIARSEEELEKVAQIAANIHGVKKVISHVKVYHGAKKIRPNNSEVSVIEPSISKEDDSIISSIDEEILEDW